MEVSLFESAVMVFEEHMLPANLAFVVQVAWLCCGTRRTLKSLGCGTCGTYTRGNPFRKKVTLSSDLPLYAASPMLMFLCYRYNSHLREKQHIYGTWRAVFAEPWVAEAFRTADTPGGGSTVLTETLLRHSMPTTKEEAWQRTLSKSYIATLPPADQQRVRTELYEIMSRYPDSWNRPSEASRDEDCVGVLPLRLELVTCRRK